MNHKTLTRIASALAGTCLFCAGASAANPYLPLWEYIPDGEPYVFEDPDNPGKFRVYIYGSHDIEQTTYCGRDQVVWSAPVDDLRRWRFDGVIFESSLDATGAPQGVERRVADLARRERLGDAGGPDEPDVVGGLGLHPLGGLRERAACQRGRLRAKARQHALEAKRTKACRAGHGRGHCHGGRSSRPASRHVNRPLRQDNHRASRACMNDA